MADSFPDAVAPTQQTAMSQECPAERRQIGAEQQQQSSLQDRLLEASLSEQLGFLAWLFDGALRRCIPESPDAGTVDSEERPAKQPRIGSEKQRQRQQQGHGPRRRGFPSGTSPRGSLFRAARLPHVAI